MRTSDLRAVALLILLLPGMASAAVGASFTLLGTLPGGTSSTPFDVSTDGLVVVGVSDDADSSQAFSWTAGVMTGLGTLPATLPGTTPGDLSSIARGVSDDGLVVAGSSTDAKAESTQAVYWAGGGGPTGLGNLGGYTSSAALDTNGSRVVGKSANSSTTQAVYWPVGGPAIGLGTLVGDTSSVASAVAADNSVIVGESSRITGVDPDTGEDIVLTEAVAWPAVGVPVGLGTLSADPDSSSSALDVSGDGSVVVGQSESDTGDVDDPITTEAFRWTSGVMTGLGFLPDATSSTAKAVSGDGTVVVGESGGQAFIWTAATGMQPLISVLIAGGVTTLDFAAVYDATGISSDGQWVVGKRGSSAFLASYSPSDLDLVPNPFSFEVQSGVALETEVISDSAIIDGITGGAAAPVTVSGGEYLIGCGAGSYTSAPGTITDGQTVCVRQTSAASGATNKNTFLTVGGVTGMFTSRTAGAGAGTSPSSSAMDGFSLLALGLFGLLRRKLTS